MPRPLPAWFANARLGMFMHYGLYSAFGGNENEIRREVGREAYAKTAKRFTAHDADPDAWAQLAADSGCDYFVLTAKHGEGFCLWPSAHTSFSVANSPCTRDLVGEAVAACRRHGLKVGIYFGPQTWISDVADDDHAGYRTMVLGMLTELLTQYGRIDLLWFDDSDEPRCTTATATAMFRLARRLQPQMLINDRGFPHRCRDLGDFNTPERFMPDRTDHGHRPWEGCDSIGVKSWGWHADERFWSAPELQRRLATAAARGGRYLLNVQPTFAGAIRTECSERFAALGAWKTAHKKALAAGDCPLVPRDACDPALPAVGVATATATRVHLLLDRWPSADEIVVPHLKGRVTARLGDQRLTVRQGHDGLRIHGLPAAPPATGVIEIVLSGTPVIERKAATAAEMPVQRPSMLGAIVLGAEAAICSADTGVPFHHRKPLTGGRVSLGFFSQMSTTVTWRAELPKRGRWRVIARLARPSTSPPAQFDIAIGRHRLTGDTQPTASWDDPADIDLGSVSLAAGIVRLQLTIIAMSNGWFADVHGVVLVPA